MKTTDVLAHDYAANYPEHDRSSCSDADPCNYSVSGNDCRRCNAILFNQHFALRSRIAALVEAIGPAKYWDHAIGDDDRICVPAASCRKISAALKAIGHG